MNQTPDRLPTPTSNHLGWWLLLAAFVVTITVYWPGLAGGFLFDDYPNIVDNHGVQPTDASFSSLMGAALSSPSSEFKRPLASLSFAANYLISGINPYWMKLTNLVIHLLNGLLVFLLARSLLLTASAGIRSRAMPLRIPDSGLTALSLSRDRIPASGIASKRAPTDAMAVVRRTGSVAALIAAGWMLLPINLTGVLYVVQRMESMANLFVLFGLLGYVAGRQQMMTGMQSDANDTSGVLQPSSSLGQRGIVLCVASIIACTGMGMLAKETAVMLPLYAILIEWILFGFRHSPLASPQPKDGTKPHRDRRIISLFLLVLAVPLVVGIVWLLPTILKPETWASRDFTLSTRLLSEIRIVVDYIIWILLPTPHALSFYHDDFRISQGLLTPWVTLVSLAVLVALITLLFWLRRRQPLAALGIALFAGCQLLTGTILPLELIYEHRNYFASFGLLLTVVPLLAVPRTESFALPRHVLLGGLMLCWAALTAMTAYAWGNPLRLAEDLASRAPGSPRAQYELGRTYIIYSHYNPTSPFTKLAYAPLERAAALPEASILPEQALIFMNSRMRLPVKDAWWNSLIAKLKAHKPGVQDESSLAALTQCVREQRCTLPEGRMVEAFMAALTHPHPSARLLATYGDYAWNILDDHELGERMIQDAVKNSPSEPAYQITLIRMLAAQGRANESKAAIRQLESLNTGGRLNNSLDELRKLPNLQ